MLVNQHRSNVDQTGAAEMFRRVLAPWAIDIMRLRRAGLDRPTARKARRLLTIPGGDFSDLGSIQPALMDHAAASRVLTGRGTAGKLRRAA